MKYLPFENITYQTKLTPAEILSRLDAIIEPRKAFRSAIIFRSKNHKPYEGSISGNSFHITRIIRYRNSFLPEIKGQVETYLGKTRVIVKMRLHPLVLIFLLIWCGAVGIFLIAFLISLIKEQTFDPSIFIPLTMLLFAYGLTTVGFKNESLKSKKYLAELFEA